MIQKITEDTALKFKNLSAEDKEKKGILGRLYGPVASFKSPTRNGRKYTQDLWEQLFESPLIKERFENGGIFGQLCHPDYEEVDMEKIACVMPEPPKKNDNGDLIAYVDIINTPCGKIAYQLAKYGIRFGISSRGTGDLVPGIDGDEVDPDTYNLTAFDLVEIPACENARLTFTESLDKTRYNKTLRQTLTEQLETASESDRKIMEDALKDLDINLEEKQELKHALREDDEVNAFMDVMASNDELQEEPSVGIFWYDKDKNDLFGIVSALAKDVPYYSNNMFDGKVKTGRALHKNIWNKESKRNKDPRFSGDYTQVPRGRVFEVENKGFVVMVGDWIEKYPEAKEEIITEFNLPEDTEFKIDDHWNLGHGWSEEGFLEEVTEEQPSEKESTEDVIPEEFTINSIESSNKFLDDIDTKLDLLYNFVDENQESLVSETELIEKLNSVINKFTSILDIINPEEEVIDVEPQEEVVDDMSDEVTAELQEALLKIKELEKDNLSLQEKLSVSNAKEVQIEEEIIKYKNAMVSLSESAKKAKNLNDKVEQLTESLNKKDKLLVSNRSKLDEMLEIRTQSNVKLEEANGKIASLENELTSLNEKLENANKDLNSYKETAVKLSKALKESKDLYLQTKAESYGLTVEDVKSKLTESYSVKDVNSVCEQLSDQARNLRALPFSYNGRVTITEAKTSGDYIANDLVNTDDEISDTLLNLIK